MHSDASVKIANDVIERTKNPEWRKFSRKEVSRSLDLFHKSDTGCFEVRALDVRGSTGRKGVVAGYFDEVALAVDAIEQIDRRRPAGIYHTIHRCHPGLIARSPNRMTEGLTPTTSDRDIEEYSGIFLDIDPIRPSGISSTDRELREALLVAIDLSPVMSDQLACNEVVITCSGNGAHIFGVWEHDFIPDDVFIRNVTTTINAAVVRMASDVTVDQSVMKLSQIVRIPGTVARKGHSLKDRPHRTAFTFLVSDSSGVFMVGH